jgi:hypothetical protein
MLLRYPPLYRDRDEGAVGCGCGVGRQAGGPGSPEPGPGGALRGPPRTGTRVRPTGELNAEHVACCLVCPPAMCLSIT